VRGGALQSKQIDLTPRAAARAGDTLGVTCDLAGLERLGPWVTSLAARHEIPDQVAFGIDLFLQEAIGNIVLHAPAGACGPIEVTVVTAPDRVFVTIADAAAPFDPTAQPLPTPPARLEDARPGGLGLRLMRTFAGECSYRHDGRRNLLTFDCPIPA